MLDRLLASLQVWLQGHPAKPGRGARRRPWFLVRIGNAISDYRYWVWRRGNDG